MMLSITMSYSHIFALDLYCVLDKKKALGKTAVALEQKKLAAHTENELGVQCFSKSQSREAIQHFTSAIELDSTNSFFYSNRSNCYQQISCKKSLFSFAPPPIIERCTLKGPFAHTRIILSQHCQPLLQI